MGKTTAHNLPEISGFTLMELLVVIALIAVLTATFIASGNYFTQIGKGRDADRKSDLAMLKIKMEDYYNDNDRYPLQSQMVNCKVPLGSYITLIPCDPQDDIPYYYETDAQGTWYRIYADLEYNQDPVIFASGCANGCGPSGNVVYDYGVSSPNVILEFGTPTCSGGVPPSCGNPAAYCSQAGSCCPGSQYTMSCGTQNWCCP